MTERRIQQLKALSQVLPMALLSLAVSTGAAETPQPSVVLLTVDTLRADRLSAYGYERPTSPHIDRLLETGTRFSRAWTVEPLTNPALASMVTGQLPHEHGASRNGLRVTPGLDSLPKVLARNGWKTAAVVSNWTLKDNISRLAEHFDDYIEVFTRRRYFGLINSEADGSDVTDEAIAWLDEHRRTDPDRPFLIWIHYIEPHAPYRYQKEFAGRIGVTGGAPSKSDRYDTEVAAADHEVGRVLAWFDEHLRNDRVLMFFTSDHGESLGEHGYWGHGRNLKEPNLRVPMGISWPGTVEQGVIDAQATIVDVGPTVLDLLGIDVPETFRGVSWAAALTRQAQPVERAACYQAHRGAVHGDHESDRARSKGLLSVGRIDGSLKEIVTVKNHARELYDLEQDPGELESLVDPGSPPSVELVQCMGEISEGLGSLDRITTQKMDEDTVEQLRALGYLE